MYSTIVLVILFFILLTVIWMLLVSNKVHDKTIEKVEKFAKDNFNNESDKGENAK